MKATVVGLGHVGLVAAAGLALAGHEVLAVDIARQRINVLNQGKVPFHETGLEERIKSVLQQGNLRFLHCSEVDEDLGEVAIVAVGTSTASGEAPGLGHVGAAVTWIKSTHPSDLVIAMKSTVPPGTGLKLLRDELADTGIGYAANPEFLREGQSIDDWDSPDRIVIGTATDDDRSADAVKRLYCGIDAPVMVTDLTSAEMVKYASNAFLATRISFINEMAALCDSLGVSIDAVSEGLAMDSRMGPRIHAGVGYGGSCLPREVGTLEKMAKAGGAKADLLRSVVEVNNRQRLLPLEALRRRFNGALAGLKVGVLGLAFKPGTDDVREAPALELIRALATEGVHVAAFDPVVMEKAHLKLPPSIRLVYSVVEAAGHAHALVLMTEWYQIVNAEWTAAAARMSPPRFLFDGRNALDPESMTGLGFEYMGVGRGPVNGANRLAGINSDSGGNLDLGGQLDP